MSEGMERHAVVIVGGGISGAAALHGLASRGVDVMMIEQSDRLGGVIRSETTPWGVIELGPNTLQSRSAGLQRLIDELGLADQVVDASPIARHRFILRDGKPVRVPFNPRDALETSLISGRGKLRLLGEAILPIGRTAPTGEESVGDFVRRRFGREALDYLVDPMISGVYAGIPDALSVAHAFPRLHALDGKGGSILRNGLRRMRAARKNGGAPEKRSIFSFRDGLAVLPRAIGEQWRNQIMFGTRVTEIEPELNQNHGWRIRIDRDGGDREIHAQHLILALPSFAAAQLLRPHNTDLADTLGLIPHAPVAVVSLCYERTAIAHPLDGFGMLIPRVESREILGALFISSIFPDRTSSDNAIITLFIGGARRPDVVDRSDSELIAVADRELRTTLDVTDGPIDGRVKIWSPGIPQYALGYGEIMRRIDEGERAHVGLDLIGSWRSGVSVPDCIDNGLQCAERIAAV